jgi:hypothetical protein
MLKRFIFCINISVITEMKQRRIGLVGNVARTRRCEMPTKFYSGILKRKILRRIY